MNQYTKLIIDDVEMDLYSVESLPLSITKRVNNLEGDVQGDFSRVSIKIPATKRNINTLGRSRSLKPFRIEVDGSPNFSGLAQIRKGKTQSQGYAAIEENYELNLISNNASWFTLLGDVLLKDCTDLVITWNDFNVNLGFTAPNPSPLPAWCFMLIKWKEWETWLGTHYQIKYEEATPGLFIYGLLTKAFNDIGYTIESDFFDTDFFGKLVIPTPIPKKLPTEFNDEYLNTQVSFNVPIVLPALMPFAYIPFTTIDVAAPQNPTAYDNAVNFYYTAPLSGYYEVEVLLQFAVVAPPTYIFLNILQVNGVNVSPPIGWALYSTGGYQQYPANGIPLTATTVVYLNAGDYIGFVWQNLDPVNTITVDYGYFKITGEAVREYGMPIDFKYLLKDWKVLDMIRGLKALFNLAFETDENRKVIKIEPKDRYLNKSKYQTNANPTSLQETKEGFYKDSETTDYSKKIDYNKDGIFEIEEVEGSFNFAYASSSDETLEWIEGSNNFKVYDARFSMDGGDPTKVRSEEVPFFVKTIHVSDIEAKYPDTNIVPQFPLIYPQNYVLDPTATDSDYDTDPRILYHAGRRVFLSDEEGDGYFDLVGIGQSYVPFTFAVNYNDTTGLDPSLSFGNEVVNGNITPGLVQTFHLQELARHNKGELRENYVRFNSIDNQNFSFRLKGIIDSQKYVVQEIEGFNPLTDEPTNFKFFFDVFPTSDDVNNIQSSTLSGLVNLLSV